MEDAKCSYSTASAYGEEGGTLLTVRQRIRIVVAGMAVVCVGLVVASACRRDQAALGSRELLLQARPAGTIGREIQEEKDEPLVTDLKAKLAKVEKGWQKEGTRALLRKKAARVHQRSLDIPAEGRYEKCVTYCHSTEEDGG